MSIRSLPWLDYLAGEALKTLRRYPLVLASGLGCCLAVVSRADLDVDQNYFWTIFLPLSLGLPLFFLATLAEEGRRPGQGPRWITSFLGLALAAYFYLAKDQENESFYLRTFQISLALHLAVSYAAFRKAGQEAPFWRFNSHLFRRFLLSSIFSFVLFAGITLALVAVHELFDMNFRDSIYLKWWSFCAFVFQPWHFTAGMPDSLKRFDKTEPYPWGLRLFCLYLLLPLFLLYVLILYVYSGKILAVWSWPQGLVGWLVSGVCLLGILTLLLLHPLTLERGSAWPRRFRKFLFPVLLPLLVLLMAAAGRRIGQYGITENRYYLVALAIWLCFICLFYIRREKADIRLIPLSLSLLVVATAFGPWGAYATSLRSQKARLLQVLDESGLLRAGHWSERRLVTRKQDQEISDLLHYLERRHGQDVLAGLAATRIRGLFYSDVPQAELSFDVGGLEFEALEVKGYDRIYLLEEGRWASHHDGQPRADLSPDNRALKIRRDKKVLAEIPMGDLVSRLATAQSGRDGAKPPVAARSVEAVLGMRKVKLVFTQMEAETEKRERPLVRSFKAYLLVHGSLETGN